MPLDIADRFDAGESLNETDRARLREIIKNNTEDDCLALAISTYFEAFSCDRDLLCQIKHILVNDPKPGIAAACLRSVIECCAESIGSSLDLTRPYVEFSRLDDWTDEVIFSANFFRRNIGQLNKFDRKKLEKFIEDASVGGASEIISILT